jgi:hypothetical protein
MINIRFNVVFVFKIDDDVIFNQPINSDISVSVVSDRNQSGIHNKSINPNGKKSRIF